MDPEKNYPKIDKTKLPNFFVLGAAKAGTTTIYAELNAHPEIYMPVNKEPMFFSSDDKYSKGLGWYSEKFFNNTNEKPARGEATPHYLYWAEKVAPRICEDLGPDQLVFIAVLRDPVERAYSWYWNMVSDGNENLQFKQAIAEEPKRLLEHGAYLRQRGSMIYGYLKGGMYAEQLAQFLERFPREKLLVLLQDDLKANYERTVNGVFEFLNVSKRVGIVAQKQNPASLPRFRQIQEFLVRPSGRMHKLAKQFTQYLSPGSRYLLKKAIRKKNLKEHSYPKMDPEIAAELRKYFRPEIEKLEGLIGRDLSAWYLV